MGDVFVNELLGLGLCSTYNWLLQWAHVTKMVDSVSIQ